MTKPPIDPTNGTPNAHLEDVTLSAYLDDELTPDEMSGATRHLESCASCRDALASLRRSARAVGKPVVPVSKATRQAQIERAIGAPSIRELPGSARRARRGLAVTRWAAALIIVAGGGVALWRFASPASRTSSSASSGTSTSAAGHGPPAAPAHGPEWNAGSLGRNAPGFQLRLLESPPRPGCTRPRAARAARAGPTSVYDASAAQTLRASMCAQVGRVLARLSGAASAHVMRTELGPLTSLIVTVPPSSARVSASLLVRHPGRMIAVVAGNEVIGYLGSVQSHSGTLTIERVPTSLAREIAAEVMPG